METSASDSSREAIDQILKKIQTILEKQSSGESEIEIPRKEIADQIAFGIVTYFSLFPQDHVFDAERLIHLWIAERFCNSSEDGGRCLSHLVGSSILQVVNEDEFGQVRKCKMLPLKLNIAKFVDSNRENITNPTTRTNVDYFKTVRRASFYSSNSQVPKEFYSTAKQLKSIFFFKTVELDLKEIFKNFKELCVLDLRNLSIKCVPKSIGDLKDLEYLDLSQNKMKKLPRSIAKLSKLHTLKLFECKSLKELPKDFQNLGKLKHLDMKECGGLTRMCPDMSKLSSLQTLFVCFQGPSLPNWLTSLTSLVKLSLQHCRGCKFKYLSKQDDQLPNLKILELVNLNHLEYIIEEYNNQEAAFYKSLEEMTIMDCPMLKSWWEKETEVRYRPLFAKLSKLHIYACPLQTMPLYRVPVKEMVLHRCTLKLLRLNTESIRLKNLRIQHCNDSTNLSGVFQHLSSLECLTIEDCDTISLHGERNAWEGLKSLSFLKLKDFQKLISLSFGDDVTTLQELTVENCSKLTSISISKLTSLQELTLHSCNGLNSISYSIDQVTSLRSLKISSCKKLESLPETILKCKSLQTLHIFDCELLEPKCVKETGVYWLQIRHIKDLKVNRTYQD